MVGGGWLPAGAGARRRAALALVLALALLATANPPIPVLAGTLTVQSGADSGGTCPGATCTLRQALAVANPNETIDFSGVTVVTLTTAQLDLTQNITIRGTGIGGVTIQRSSAIGTPDFRIFAVGSGVTATLQGLTITNGKANGNGGDISSSGALNLIDTIVSAGSAVYGGGIAAENGSLALTNSEVSGNTATGRGGGVHISTATATVTNSLISTNTAGDGGGGLHTISNTLTMTDSRISGNTTTSGSGGGLLNDSGAVTLANCIVSGNSAPAGTGGGALSYALGPSLIVINSTVSGNSAKDGGGLGNDNGTLTMARSTVSGNATENDGGGIYHFSGTATLTNSTISGNSAANGGSFSNVIGMATLVAVTVTGNTATGGNSGGGLMTYDGTTTFSASIVAGNIGNPGSGADCVVYAGRSGVNATSGYNVVGSGTGCPSNGTGDAAHGGAITALLNPTLAANGGTSQNHALVVNSPALDRLPAAQCAILALTTDQRNVARPQGADCDSGAYEARTFTLATSTGGTGTGTVSAGGNFLEGATASAVATPTGGSTFSGWILDGSPAGTVNPLNVTMGANRNLIATFAAPPSPSPSPSPSPPPSSSPPPSPAPTVLLTVNIVGSGTVGRNPTGTGSGPFAYPPKEIAILIPQPGAGQTFAGWVVDGVYKGWAGPPTVPLTITMDASHTVQATFVATRAFADVPSSRPDFVAIVALASRGTILGYNATSYGPDDGVQRAQMAALIARATPAGPGTPPATLTPPACTVAGTWDCEAWPNGFTDRGTLIAALWNDVAALGHYGVAKGYTAADCAARGLAFPCFAPTAPVSYIETVVFITRAMIAKGYWVSQPTAAHPYAGFPAVFAPEVATFHFYTAGAGGIPAPPGNWNAGATRGWFARALWQALNAYWGTDGPLPSNQPAGGFVP